MYEKNDYQEIQRIPDECRERFIHFGQDQARFWPQHEVDVSGLSDLTRGYYVERMKFTSHVALVLTKGSLSYRDADGEREIEAGQMMFMPAFWKCRYEVKDSCSMVWLHLNAQSPFWQDLKGSRAHVFQARNTSKIPLLMEILYEEIASPTEGNSVSQQLLCQLILQYLHDDLFAPPDASMARARLDACFRKVAEKPDYPWVVEDLCRMAFMSRPALFLAVQKLYGLPPMTIVRHQRLNAAARILLNTNEDLDFVARQTGFDSGYSLSRAFRKLYGMPPGRWRKAFMNTNIAFD